LAARQVFIQLSPIVRLTLRFSTAALAAIVAAPALSLAAQATAARLASSPRPTVTASVPGDYQGIRADNKPLPVRDQLASAPGTFRAVSVSVMSATLRPNGRFSAFFRYTNETVRSGQTPKYSPTQDTRVEGKYSVQGAAITFVPDRSKNQKFRPVSGKVTGQTLVMPVQMNDAGKLRTFTFELKKLRDF
jgi:hypothetical protein